MQRDAYWTKYLQSCIIKVRPRLISFCSSFEVESQHPDIFVIQISHAISTDLKNERFQHLFQRCNTMKRLTLTQQSYFFIPYNRSVFNLKIAWKTIMLNVWIY